jgi:hypothetical protein
MDTMNPPDTATPLTEEALAAAMGGDNGKDNPKPPESFPLIENALINPKVNKADPALYKEEDLPEQAKVFWSPPDIPWPEEDYEDIEILGAVVVRAETSEKSNQVVMSCVVSSNEKLTVIRFRIANHSRLARKFFLKGGMKQVPRQDGEVTVDGGAYFIQLAGTIIGEDNIPESAKGVERALVLDDVVAKPISV